jgi:(p)ppGpp synthase/HD superfamily hydrolase
MIEPILEFLMKNDAARNGHSGRKLIDHLTGTADLLAKWNCEMDVVLAGLCHSVYGTDSFHTVTIDPSRRDEVRALIGERAEQLAWEFGNRKNPRIVSFIRNNEIDLILIECANLIEQQVDPSQLAAATVVQLPDNVREAVNDYLGTYH